MLKIKKGVHWEELPEDIMPKIPDVNTMVEYHFTEKFTEHIKGGGKRESYKENVTLPPIFNAQINGKWHTFGIVGGYDERGNPNPGEVRQLTFQAKELSGKLYVHPSNSEQDMDLFLALEFHPKVGGATNADVNTPKVLQKVDHIAVATQSREETAALREALGIVYTMKEGIETERACLLLGIAYSVKGVKRANQLVMDDIEVQAKATPKHFISILNDKDGTIKADFSKALELKVVKIDSEARQVRWGANDQVIMGLTRTDERDAREEFATFVNNEGPGAELYKKMVQQNKGVMKTL